MGKMTYKNGEIFEGKWENNFRNRPGRITYKNGDTFECNCKNDKKTGKGIHTQKSGTVTITTVSYWDDDIELPHVIRRLTFYKNNYFF